MNTKFVIGIAAALLLVLAGFALNYALSNARIRRLENAVEKSSAAAAHAELTAAKRETEAAAYNEKIEYLETSLDEIRGRAAEQDEKLEKLTNTRRGARVDFDRARRTRSVAATPAELCEKLAELGHPCEK